MDISHLYIETLIICLIFSSFFSGAETALTCLSEAKTRQLIESKKRGTRALRLWLRSPNHVLTALLVGNNIVNTLAAAITTVIAQQLFGNFAIGIATGATTLILLIFGEVTPKTFAKHNAETIAPIAMTVLIPIYWLLAPLVYLVSWLATLLVRIAGGKSSRTGPVATEEDITFMIRLGHKEGVLAREEGEMLESVIEFRETLVKEAMVPRTEICSFNKDAQLEEVIAQIAENGHSRWPVYQDKVDNIIGVFHAKDLIRALQQDRASFGLEKYLRPAIFVPSTMKIGGLLKEFRHGKAHLAIVVDEYGGTAGIISLEDVLEEIVGEIRDEYDDEEDEKVLHQINETTFLADGKASIDKVGEALKVEFPDSEPYESLGGFLTATYGKMPAPKTAIDYRGWRFVIKEADEKRIVRVLATKLPDDISDSANKES